MPPEYHFVRRSVTGKSTATYCVDIGDGSNGGGTRLTFNNVEFASPATAAIRTRSAISTGTGTLWNCTLPTTVFDTTNFDSGWLVMANPGQFSQVDLTSGTVSADQSEGWKWVSGAAAHYFQGWYTAATDVAMQHHVFTDAQPRIAVRVDGVRMGPGGATTMDTVIDRDGVGIVRINSAAGNTGGLEVRGKLFNGAQPTLTVAANAVTVAGWQHLIDATGSPTLKTISGGTTTEMLILQKVNAGTVTLDETGNIALGAATRALDATTDVITLLWNGTKWCEVSFANND